ncbi:hypothetical protein EV207_101146 [Scopulibacillus darangshiensis]|uniref:Uncharacterized protein n=1 Tax=Scopulibacillus darangshiensis TaxID=442528 RepID=A0A4R2PCL9_9BACL|nr:hypothetical protein [Scopulibacillus darangshiensis]TCP32168.1 hypothetical protein EV207_101146 [Scopulibacillus darangshiensis]
MQTLLKKTVRSGDKHKFDKEYNQALDEGWTPKDETRVMHGQYGSFYMAVFGK